MELQQSSRGPKLWNDRLMAGQVLCAFVSAVVFIASGWPFRLNGL